MVEKFGVTLGRKIAHQYYEAIKEEIKVNSLYLFGSYAKNNANNDSDVDIAVVSNDFSGDPVDDLVFLMSLRRKVNLKIEPHPFLPVDFNRSNPIASEILNYGIKIV